MFENIGVWSFGLNVIILAVSVGGFIKIMRNDLFHLEKDMKEIKVTLGNMDKKLDTTAERISKVEGTCKANHG